MGSTTRCQLRCQLRQLSIILSIKESHIVCVLSLCSKTRSLTRNSKKPCHVLIYVMWEYNMAVVEIQHNMVSLDSLGPIACPGSSSLLEVLPVNVYACCLYANADSSTKGVHA